MDTSWAQFRTEVEQTWEEKALLSQARHAFHALWGMHKGQMPYDKDCWMALQLALNRLGVKI